MNYQLPYADSPQESKNLKSQVGSEDMEILVWNLWNPTSGQVEPNERAGLDLKGHLTQDWWVGLFHGKFCFQQSAHVQIQLPNSQRPSEWLSWESFMQVHLICLQKQIT